MSELACLLRFIARFSLQAKFAAERLFKSAGKNLSVFDTLLGVEETKLGEISVLLILLLLFLIGLVFGRFGSSAGGRQSLGRCCLGRF